MLLLLVFFPCLVCFTALLLQIKMFSGIEISFEWMIYNAYSSPAQWSTSPQYLWPWTGSGCLCLCKNQCKNLRADLTLHLFCLSSSRLFFWNRPIWCPSCCWLDYPSAFEGQIASFWAWHSVICNCRAPSSFLDVFVLFSESPQMLFCWGRVGSCMFLHMWDHPLTLEKKALRELISQVIWD